MVAYKTFPYMGYPYMPKIHTWLAYMHVMYSPIYDFFLQGMLEVYQIYINYWQIFVFQ